MIDESGRKLGVMPTSQAIAEARRRGLDLIEVAPHNNPVVCKILDYGKFIYRKEKRERKLWRQKIHRIKEMRFTTQIEEHDFATKMGHIRRFLEHDSKVKVTVIFRGREIVHMNRGRELLNRIVKEIQGVGKVDQPAKERGKSLQMVLVPASSNERKTSTPQQSSQQVEGVNPNAQEEDTQRHGQAV